MNNSSQDDPSSRNSAAGPSLTSGIRAAAERHARADRRRAGLRRMLQTRQLTPAELARIIGAPNANAFYNFLNGRSDALALDTVEMILAAFPDLSFPELVGLPPPAGTLIAPEREVIVRIRAIAGPWSWEPEWPDVLQDRVVIPAGLIAGLPGVFAVQMNDAGAGLLYPPGSLLVCRPLPATWEEIPSGSRVVVRYQRNRRFRTVVREITRDGDRIRLWPRSSDPRYRPPYHGPVAVPLLEPSQGPHGTTVTILGIVVASWQPEEGTDHR